MPLYDTANSKYYYPDTNVLINKLDIYDNDLLKEAESLFTGQRLLELQAAPLQGDFNMKHLLNIHYYIFQDLYDFAGKVRDEDLSKNYTFFAKFQFIISNAEDLFNKLNSDHSIGTSIEIFSDKAAYYMAELNILHPFREGNGRAIREFIRCLALNNNHILNWTIVDKDELLEASIKSIVNTVPLADCIRKCIEIL
jgi:cell filamentation protein